jgi:hypothetical protein
MPHLITSIKYELDLVKIILALVDKLSMHAPIQFVFSANLPFNASPVPLRQLHDSLRHPAPATQVDSKEYPQPRPSNRPCGSAGPILLGGADL